MDSLYNSVKFILKTREDGLAEEYAINVTVKAVIESKASESQTITAIVGANGLA